jgi:hypothetical protein
MKNGFVIRHQDSQLRKSSRAGNQLPVAPQVATAIEGGLTINHFDYDHPPSPRLRRAGEHESAPALPDSQLF